MAQKLQTSYAPNIIWKKNWFQWCERFISNNHTISHHCAEMKVIQQKRILLHGHWPSSSSTLKLLWEQFSLLGWHPPSPFLLHTTTLLAASLSVPVCAHIVRCSDSVFRYGCWLKGTVQILFFWSMQYRWVCTCSREQSVIALWRIRSLGRVRPTATNSFLLRKLN